MYAFQFYSPTRFYFGKNAEENIGKALKSDGAKKVLLHYGKGSVVRSGLLDRAKKQLESTGIPYAELGGAVPNPHEDLVIEGAALCKKESVDYVLALGGGSALDSAKAIAVLAANPDSTLWQFYNKEKKVTKALPIATVMTFPATGSEASNSSVITFPEHNRKRGLNSDFIRPKIAFLNPELTYTLPEKQTFYGISDMMAHTMERYFNNTEDAQLTDAWSEALLREVIRAARIVYRDPENYEARSLIMWASTMAHNGILGVGVEKEDWTSHQLSHELSLSYDVAHGAALAVVFPNWLRYAVLVKKNTHKICRFAREVFGIRGNLNNPERLALEGIDALQSFYRSVGLPVSFKDLGVGPEAVEKMADNVLTGPDGSCGGYIKTYRNDFAEIYKLCCEER